jgi:transposase
MARCLSEDLRVRVIEAVEAGASRRQAAARFGVSVSSAIRWVDAHRREGRIQALPQGGDRRSQAIEAQGEFLRAAIREAPDATLAELRGRLWRECGVAVSVSALWRFFDRHKITLKKSPRTRPSRSVRT